MTVTVAELRGTKTHWARLPAVPPIREPYEKVRARAQCPQGQQAGHLVCFTERGWDEAAAWARILDDLDQQLTSRVGADKPDQLQDLLAEVTNLLCDST